MCDRDYFGVLQVSDVDPGLFEPLGTKAKFWYGGNAALFKEGRQNTGENWAEVVAAEVAAGLGLPHAEYSLAEFNGVRGVSTPNFVPAGARLVLGNELVLPVAAGETNLRQVRRQGHTAKRMANLLRHPRIRPPIGFALPPSADGAAGVMTGYLLLDALIGNQDRHEENWGLIVQSSYISLAPSFDHASSLGRNETDNVRIAKLEAADRGHGIEAYALKAKSQIFGQDGKRLRTVEAFGEFNAQFPASGRYWRERLGQLDTGFLRDVLERVPPDWITEPARTFAWKLMEFNRHRLLECKL